MNRAQRLLLSGVALTALLAAVAVASRAHRPGGGAGGGSADTGRVVFEYTASVMFVLLPLGALFVLWVLSMGRRQKLIQESGGLRRNVVTVLAVAVLILPVTLLVRHYVKYDGGGAGQRTEPPGALTDGTARGGDQRKDPQFQWLPALIAGSLIFGVAGAGAFAFVLRRQRGADWDREAELMRALDEVLEDTLDDLRAERDPRKAVIGAYARMERLFGAHQVGREEAETPQQYVERVLDRLQVSSFAVRRLTQLYERARFSPHTVDAEMKDDAIAALEGLRAELTPDTAVAA